MVKETISVTLDPEINNKLVEKSDEEKRSKSSMVNWILTNYFSDKPERE
ncbi:MAG: TraY domain-containing protein [Candidatus Omnitrophica bacterium]|nr:TraY domain-containing protein [Candidatus Omnitrophota bacterium]